MDSTVSHVRERLTQIERRIAAALALAGRTQQVQVVGVTKYLEADRMTSLKSAGIHIFAENRVQAALLKQEWFATRPSGEQPDAWHFIGHIQRNKLARIVGRFELIHSVDSLPLLELLSRLCAEQGIVQRYLLEVNISGETAKEGFAPEALAELAPELLSRPGLVLEGLMGMAAEADADTVRSSFRLLAELRDRLQARLGRPLPELSMGMSGDFEIAVGEGATLVRIGSLLYS